MPDIDLPSLKEQLWQKMQGDLAKFIPDVVERNRLMCCACGRFLPPEHFDVDHMISQRAIKCDPEEVRKNPDVNKRPRLPPRSLGRSIAWLADRRRDPAPINIETHNTAIRTFLTESKNQDAIKMAGHALALSVSARALADRRSAAGAFAEGLRALEARSIDLAKLHCSTSDKRFDRVDGEPNPAFILR